MLARGTACSSAGRCGMTFRAVSASSSAMKASPRALIEAFGTSRSARQASTAASSSSGVAEGKPASASSAVTRSRLGRASEGSGARPVMARTQRS